MTHACFCAAMAPHLGTPAVARALDRLRDEVTIALCLMTTMAPAQAGLGRLRDWRGKRAIRKKPFERALDALAHGPLPLELLAEDVYGPPVADAEEMRLRRMRVRMLMVRQARLGRVVRVGNGTYALPGRTEGMRLRGLDDCRAILADPRVQPAGGLTAAEIAERFDVSVSAVRKWIGRLRAEGAPLIARRESFVGRGSGGHRYRIAQEVA